MEIGTHFTRTHLMLRHIFKDRILDGEVMKDDHSHWNHAILKSREYPTDSSANKLKEDDSRRKRVSN